MVISRDTQSLTRLAITATAAVGLAASVAVGCAAISADGHIAQLAFIKKAGESLQAIQSQVANANDALFTLRDLLDATEHPIKVGEYQFFASRLRERVRGLRDTGWAPRITRANREVFEESVRRTGVADYRILERDKAGRRLPAPDRDFFFPILYPDPLSIAPKVLGANITFEPMRLRAVLHAIETRAPAATPPLQLISGQGMIDGFMSFLPVFGKDDASGEPQGVVYGVFEIAPLIENILTTALPSKDVGVYMFDPAKPPDAPPIHWHSATGASGTGAPARSDLLAQPHWEGTLHMADQTWGVIFVPDRFSTAGWILPGLAPFAIGLLITAMIEAYLLISMRRTTQLESLTEELRATAEKLAKRGEKLSYLARHDPLTGVRNRTGFAEEMRHLASQDPEQGRLAVLMLDLDRFKAVNDTLGHAAGDLLLCQVSNRLRENVQPDDLVARLGGDEFVIIRPGSCQPDAEILAGRLLDALCRPYRICDQDVEIGVSIGIAICERAEVDDDRMLQRADRALYNAKISGRGTWRLCPAGDAADARGHAA